MVTLSMIKCKFLYLQFLKYFNLRFVTPLRLISHDYLIAYTQDKAISAHTKNRVASKLQFTGNFSYEVFEEQLLVCNKKSKSLQSFVSMNTYTFFFVKKDSHSSSFL